eukprot:m.224315 g.224315  ORF g.224315 m.224315 type:complete len:402 (-) comp22336_c3_seq2:522-1727(-)
MVVLLQGRMPLVLVLVLVVSELLLGAVSVAVTAAVVLVLVLVMPLLPVLVAVMVVVVIVEMLGVLLKAVVVLVTVLDVVLAVVVVMDSSCSLADCHVSSTLAVLTASAVRASLTTEVRKVTGVDTGPTEMAPVDSTAKAATLTVYTESGSRPVTTCSFSGAAAVSLRTSSPLAALRTSTKKPLASWASDTAIFHRTTMDRSVTVRKATSVGEELKANATRVAQRRSEVAVGAAASARLGVAHGDVGKQVVWLAAGWYSKGTSQGWHCVSRVAEPHCCTRWPGPHTRSGAQGSSAGSGAKRPGGQGRHTRSVLGVGLASGSKPAAHVAAAATQRTPSPGEKLPGPQAAHTRSVSAVGAASSSWPGPHTVLGTQASGGLASVGVGWCWCSGSAQGTHAASVLL